MSPDVLAKFEVLVTRLKTGLRANLTRCYEGTPAVEVVHSPGGQIGLAVMFLPGELAAHFIDLLGDILGQPDIRDTEVIRSNPARN